MIENEQQLKKILEIMNTEGILNDVILIGSWCLLFYKNIFENFEPLIRTTDLDFYVPDAKKIKEKNGLINTLRVENYDLISDTLTNKSTFISPDGFELEFITKLNRKKLDCVQLGKTRIYAESISYVDIFSANYIDVCYGDISFKIASPSSYVLQKLLINEMRKEKSEKDILSIKYVLEYIRSSKKSQDELVALFVSLPKKWQNKILNTCSKNDIKFK